MCDRFRHLSSAGRFLIPQTPAKQTVRSSHSEGVTTCLTTASWVSRLAHRKEVKCLGSCALAVFEASTNDVALVDFSCWPFRESRPPARNHMSHPLAALLSTRFPLPTCIPRQGTSPCNAVGSPCRSRHGPNPQALPSHPPASFTPARRRPSRGPSVWGGVVALTLLT